MSETGGGPPSVATDAEDAAVGLIYSDHLPVVWTPLAEPPDATTLARLNDENLQVLHAVAALEEYPVEPDEDDGAMGHVLARLDMKVNLLLGLVGDLVAEHHQLPSAVPVQLGGDRLIWRDPNLKLSGKSPGIAAVYLRASPATPLRLAGELEAARDNNAESTFKLDCLHLDEAVRNGLERMIFRHHRRSIAGRHPHD
jgi:hypothetical protein